MTRMKTITINGGIGYDATYDSVKSQFDVLNGEDIEIQISSYGGFVSDGILIYNMIRDYKRKYPESQIMAIVKSDALSAASYIFSNPAIDLRYVEDNSILMIHNPYNGVIGDYRDMGKNADFLERMTAMMARSYAIVSGKKIDEIRQIMDDETWLFGEEIVAAGFADDVIETKEKKDKDEQMAVAVAQFELAQKKVMSEPYTGNEFERLAAKLESTLNNEIIPAVGGVKNKLEVQMDLQEFLKSNPDARAEYDTALQSARADGKEEAEKDVIADRKRIARILNLVDVPLSENAIEALEKGISASQFAEDELERQKKLRSETENGSIFGGLASKQTPKEQAASEDVEKQLEEFDKKAREMAKKAYGGK